MNRAQEVLSTIDGAGKQTLPPQFVYDKVRELRKSGKSDEEISKMLKITLGVIQGIK